MAARSRASLTPAGSSKDGREIVCRENDGREMSDSDGSDATAACTPATAPSPASFNAAPAAPAAPPKSFKAAPVLPPTSFSTLPALPPASRSAEPTLGKTSLPKRRKWPPRFLNAAPGRPGGNDGGGGGGLGLPDTAASAQPSKSNGSLSTRNGSHRRWNSGVCCSSTLSTTPAPPAMATFFA